MGRTVGAKNRPKEEIEREKKEKEERRLKSGGIKKAPLTDEQKALKE